jgi:hypothetical protein
MQILTMELIATVLLYFWNKWRTEKKRNWETKTTKTQLIEQVDQIW